MTIDVRKILCPIDFSRHADMVVEWAAHLAEEHSSELILLHAYHLPVEFQQLEGAYLPADFWESVKEEAERSLAGYGAKLRETGLEVREIAQNGLVVGLEEWIASRVGVDGAELLRVQFREIQVERGRDDRALQPG